MFSVSQNSDLMNLIICNYFDKYHDMVLLQFGRVSYINTNDNNDFLNNKSECNILSHLSKKGTFGLEKFIEVNKSFFAYNQDEDGK